MRHLDETPSEILVTTQPKLIVNSKAVKCQRVEVPLTVKGRSLVLDLVTCYSRDAQREWMKLSSEVTWTKVRNPEKLCK